MMWLSGISILSSLHLTLLIQRGVFVVGVVMHGANSKETGEVSHRCCRAGEAAESLQMEESGSDGCTEYHQLLVSPLGTLKCS